MNSTPSSYSNLWWAIDGVLAGMGMPFVAPERRYNSGGSLDAFADDLPALYKSGIRAIVSLLNIPGDVSVFQSAGFAYKSLPINDGQPPTFAQAAEFVGFVNECRSRKMPVAVFCQAGLGRTGTMIACYFISSSATAAEAIEMVRKVESSAVETAHQIRFLEEFEGQQGRNG